MPRYLEASKSNSVPAHFICAGLISIVVITAMLTFFTLNISNISTGEIHSATPGGFIKRQKTSLNNNLKHHGSSSLVSGGTYAPTYMPTVRVTMSEDEYHNMTQYINSRIHSNGVVIFAKSYCKHSKAASIMKNMHQLPPELIIDVDLVKNGSSIQEGLTRMTGQTTVPYVYVKEKFLGGNVDVQEMADNGELQQLISSISSHAGGNAKEEGGRRRVLRRAPKHVHVVVE
eukprot:scaffold2763_cov88-Skeletonema_dohrnii-CCMP3373.AAC.2